MDDIQAFPSAFQFENDGLRGGGFHVGMTLRDYFAGQVLKQLSLSGGPMDSWPNWHSKKAYELADAMLKERKKENKEIK